MQYIYYPGCSSHATGRAYDESLQAVAGPLGVELKELADWNCCGATAYMGVNEMLSFSLTARNLAIAEKEQLPVCTPCSACYLNLKKTNVYLNQYPDLKQKVDLALAEGGMSYKGGVQTKHFLEVVVDDVGLDKVKSLVKRPLDGLKVAPYYGCQIVRPLPCTNEKDLENPMMLESVIEAIGATAVPYALKTHCCGGSLMGTQNKVALRLCRNLFLCAQEAKADCIAVTCPLCQINLDAYQKRVNKVYETNFNFPILFFTQLMGLAFGLAPKKIGLHRSIVPIGPAVGRYAEVGA